MTIEIKLNYGEFVIATRGSSMIRHQTCCRVKDFSFATCCFCLVTFDSEDQKARFIMKYC